MNLRIKTTDSIELKLNELQNWLHLSSKAAVMRIGMSYAIKLEKGNEVDNYLYDAKDKNGQDYLRLTVFGNDESFYKYLIENKINRKIDDDEFFPKMVSYFMEKGVSLIYSEYKYLNDKNKFINKLLN